MYLGETVAKLSSTNCHFSVFFSEYSLHNPSSHSLMTSAFSGEQGDPTGFEITRCFT